MPNSQKRCILIVEDDLDLRQAIVDVVREAGWEVLQAADGQQCLVLAGMYRPDVIVLDYRMPGMHGGEVCTRLRRQQITSRILFISAATDISEIINHRGGDALLRKPFQAETLLDAIHELASGSPSDAS